MPINIRPLVSGLVCGLLAFAVPVVHAAYDIPQTVIASGGDTSLSGSTVATGTIGQGVLGTSSGGAYVISGGFWGGGAGGALFNLAVSVAIAGSGAGAVASNPAGIACAPTCGMTFNSVAGVTLTATPTDGNSVFTGWLGGCTGRADCTFTSAGAENVTATFAPNNAFSLSLDVDENGAYDALTDGLLILRFLFGLTGDALTGGAIGAEAALTTPAQIQLRLDDIRPLLDIDGNGQVDALTDGLLVIRYLFGLRGNSLVSGAIGAGASRIAAPQIAPHLQSLLP